MIRKYAPFTAVLFALTLALTLAPDLLFANSTQGARVPVFLPDYTESWESGTIMSSNRGVAPCVIDWNGDGRKDLLLGSFYYGNIYVFENIGTDAVPAFDKRYKLEADGVEISLSYG